MFWKTVGDPKINFKMMTQRKLLHSFHMPGLFPHPLTKSENLCFSDIFLRYRKRPKAWNGLTCCFILISLLFMWVNSLRKVEVFFNQIKNTYSKSSKRKLEHYLKIVKTNQWRHQYVVFLRLIWECYFYLLGIAYFRNEDFRQWQKV